MEIKQQNAQACSLDIYVVISHWIFQTCFSA